MRMMLRFSMDVESANRAAESGILGDILERTRRRIRPEAGYFFADQGRRSGLFFFDMKDPSEIPQIAEPLFTRLGAQVDFLPVMNQEDLKKGLEAWGRSRE
jgi:hypothetical protein